jgi:citrate lyase alpha subunit
MPDLKSELSKVLNEWDKDETINETIPETIANQPKEKKVFPQPANVSIDTYNYILANPNKTVQQYTDQLVAQYKFKPASVSSLIYQMLKVGRLQRSDKGVYAVDAVYRAIKPSELKAARKASKANAPAKPKKEAPIFKEKQSAGIAALKNPQPLAQVMQRSAIITTNFSVDNILKNLTIMQAKELRDALNNLFK